jgi:hypothetical protein
MDLRYEGVERDRPLPAGSITVVPAGSSVLWRRQGSIDSLLIYLEPSLVARVAAESFEFDSTRTVVLPLDGLNAPELRSAMLAVDAELRGGGGGGLLLVESLAIILCVHLIRHIVLVVWMINLIGSTLWLRAFRFGPIEWVFRKNLLKENKLLQELGRRVMLVCS